MAVNLTREHRFVVDADGFRQTRKAGNRTLFAFAADQVLRTADPFTFGVLKFDRTADHPP